VFSAPGTAQGTPRMFCVVVDDIRFLRPDVEGTERLLAVLRDEVLTDGDMVGVVSTGPTAVTADVRNARDRTRLDRAIQRIVDGPFLLEGAAAERPIDPAQLRQHTQVTLGTLADVVHGLGEVRDHEKIVLILASGATSAASFEAVLAAMDGAAGPASGEPGATDLLRELSKIASAAKQANVTIRAIDPKDPSSADVLRSLK
jgi:hypothetical protein